MENRIADRPARNSHRLTVKSQIKGMDVHAPGPMPAEGSTSKRLAMSLPRSSRSRGARGPARDRHRPKKTRSSNIVDMDNASTSSLQLRRAASCATKSSHRADTLLNAASIHESKLKKLSPLIYGRSLSGQRTADRQALGDWISACLAGVDLLLMRPPFRWGHSSVGRASRSQ